MGRAPGLTVRPSYGVQSIFFMQAARDFDRNHEMMTGVLLQVSFHFGLDGGVRDNLDIPCRQGGTA